MKSFKTWCRWALVILFAVITFTLGVMLWPDPADSGTANQAQRIIDQQTQLPDLNIKRNSVESRTQGVSINSTTPEVRQKKYENAQQLCANLTFDKANKLDIESLDRALHDRLMASQGALEHWLQSLVVNGNQLQKLAATALLISVEDMKIRNAAYQGNPLCERDPTCSTQLTQAVVARTQSEIRSIVNIATYSSDPVAYGIAHNVCVRFGARNDSFCANINANQWLTRDADNGIAALYAVSEMALPKLGEDVTAFENAMYRLSIAKRFETYFDIVKLLPPLPEALNDFSTRTSYEKMLANYWDQSPLPSHKNIVPACRGDYLKSQNRQQLCQAIARQYLREDGFFLERALFLKMTTNMHWDADELKKVRDDHDAVSAFLTQKEKRQETQLTDPEQRGALCIKRLNEYHAAQKYIQAGEFKTYLEEMNASEFVRDDLIKVGRSLREARSR